MKYLSRQDFEQDVESAIEATEQGPVFITNEGYPAYVMLSVEGYQTLLQRSAEPVDLLAMLEEDDVDALSSRLDLALNVPDLSSTPVDES